VISAGYGLEGLPLHVLPGWVDQFDISYTPSAALLQTSIPDLLPQGVELHRGTDQPPLPLADQELHNIACTHDVADRSANFLRPGRRLVHYSGHGSTGPSIADRRLHFADHHLSLGQLLTDGDYAGVELVTLSACASGTFVEVSAGPQEFGGVDATLIAIGARGVVSASWIVHDTAATLFMTVLHIGLANHGDTATAFRDARDALRQGRGGALERFADRLDAIWPTWRNEIEADHVLVQPIHGGAFRLAGRYW
jgi:CHAT domain-containing protein